MTKVTIVKKLKKILKAAAPLGLSLAVLGIANTASSTPVNVQGKISELKKPAQRLVLQLAKSSNNSNAVNCAHASHSSHSSHSSHRSHSSHYSSS